MPLVYFCSGKIISTRLHDKFIDEKLYRNEIAKKSQSQTEKKHCSKMLLNSMKTHLVLMFQATTFNAIIAESKQNLKRIDGTKIGIFYILPHSSSWALSCFGVSLPSHIFRKRTIQKLTFPQPFPVSLTLRSVWVLQIHFEIKTKRRHTQLSCWILFTGFFRQCDLKRWKSFHHNTKYRCKRNWSTTSLTWRLTKA